MTAEQNALVDMFQGVESFCDANNSVWSSKPFFADPYNAFKANIPLIFDALTDQMAPVTGGTAEKEAMRETLEAIMNKIAEAGRALAAITKNTELRDALADSPSELKRMPERSLIGTAGVVYENTFPHAAALVAYGIVADDFTALNDAKDDFTALLSKGQNAVSRRETATTRLGELIKANNSILRETLDLSAKALAVFDEDFVMTYFNERSIDDPAYQRISLKVHVIDGASGKPMEDAIIVVQPGELKRRSSRLGNAIFKHLPAEVMTVEITRTGYTPVTLPANIVEGQTEHLTVILEKA